MDHSERIVKISHKDWLSGQDPWRGHLSGERLGSDVTLVFYATDEIGKGPVWHVHPYDEIFIIKKGRALYTIGDQKIEANEGDVLMGPRDIPHKFHNIGPGRLETMDVHLNPSWIQTDLADPELKT